VYTDLGRSKKWTLPRAIGAGRPLPATAADLSVRRDGRSPFVPSVEPPTPSSAARGTTTSWRRSTGWRSALECCHHAPRVRGAGREPRRRGAATPQMPARCRNPQGAWGLRAISSLVLAEGAPIPPPLALPCRVNPER
jgi:hypothetical protein